MDAGDRAGADTLVSAGTLLGGRVIYHQRTDGYRTGIEPVLLAAAIPARPGERVVEAGIGAGAGLLCLAARVPGLHGLGLEVDPALAGLATSNIAANRLANLSVQVQDVTAWRPSEPFDHAFANPPWHRPDGTASPQPGRRLAKVAAADLLGRWVGALAGGLRRRGTLSLIVPASCLAEAMSALVRADCPEVSVTPLWPRAGAAARLVILQGVRLGGGGGVLLPGLVLHSDDGFSAQADAVLRHGGALCCGAEQV